MLAIGNFNEMSSLKRQDIREQVFDILLEQITTGVWKPGDKLPSESELTKTLGVSRITIREAIQKLAGLDLVESKQGKGSFVKTFTPNDYLKRLVPMVEMTKEQLLYLLEYREVLEMGIIGLAVERGTPEDVKVLKDYTEEMNENLENYKQYAHYDTLFHLKLAQMTQNPVMENASEGIRELLEAQIQQTLSPKGARAGVLFHSRIIAAIEKKDKAEAASLMKKLLDDVVDAENSK